MYMYIYIYIHTYIYTYINMYRTLYPGIRLVQNIRCDMEQMIHTPRVLQTSQMIVHHTGVHF